MDDPLLSEALNPRKALDRRMRAAEEPAPPASADSSQSKFIRPRSPEEKLRQQKALAEMLRRRREQP